MPIYEYLCRSCRRKSSIFVRTVSSPVNAVCSHCGGSEMDRAVSAFAHHRSREARWEEAGHPYEMGDEAYDDAANVGRYAEARAAEMGVELPGEIKEMIEAARQGEKPKPPDYGGADMPDPLREL